MVAKDETTICAIQVPKIASLGITEGMRNSSLKGDVFTINNAMTNIYHQKANKKSGKRFGTMMIQIDTPHENFLRPFIHFVPYYHRSQIQIRHIQKIIQTIETQKSSFFYGILAIVLKNCTSELTQILTPVCPIFYNSGIYLTNQLNITPSKKVTCSFPLFINTCNTLCPE